MLKLDLNREPRTLELVPGVTITHLPIGTSLMLDVQVNEELPDPEGNAEAYGLALAGALARRAITAWEGVGDQAGKPLPVTREAIDALLEVVTVFEAWQVKVVQPAVLALEEKNGSAPSLNGISAGARTTAPAAGKSARTARKSKTGRKR